MFLYPYTAGMCILPVASNYSWNFFISKGDIIVVACFRFEKYYGKMATGSLCVTKAMQHELDQNWGVR